MNFIYYNLFCVYCSQNKLGETPLHIAAKYGHTKCVKLLLHKGADIQIKVSLLVQWLFFFLL